MHSDTFKKGKNKETGLGEKGILMERRKAQGTAPKIPNCDLFPGVAPICSHQVMHLWFSQSPNGGALSEVQVIYLPYNRVRA